jgi:hypothetical protein
VAVSGAHIRGTGFRRPSSGEGLLFGATVHLAMGNGPNDFRKKARATAGRKAECRLDLKIARSIPG